MTEKRENEIIRNEIRYKDGFSNDKVYDPKEYTIVKREKIDFWRKELLNKTDEVLKSMREVLGID